jgi:ABC-type polysaccharide/polyol phosphate export permease
MFHAPQARTGAQGAFRTFELIYHSIIRELRKTHRHAVIGLLMNILQTMILVVTFYIMFTMLGLRSNAIRGDFLLFVMTGIFMFISHTKAMSAVMGSEGPTSAMMKHRPMNTIIAVSSAAIAALYIQVLSAIVVLFLYHAIITPLEIYQPINCMLMLILAWFFGVAVGMVFLAMKPWFPQFTTIVSTIWTRANMVASGKMFLANTLPGFMIDWFDWNPLFHIIDQVRGFAFINYNPHFSSLTYPLIASIVLLMIGMIGESYTRKKASLSWSAGK